MEFPNVQQLNFHSSIWKDYKLTWYLDLYMFNLLSYIFWNNVMQNSSYLIKIMFINQKQLSMWRRGMKLFSEAHIGKDFISRVTFYIKNKIGVALLECGWKSQIMELTCDSRKPSLSFSPVSLMTRAWGAPEHLA